MHSHHLANRVKPQPAVSYPIRLIGAILEPTARLASTMGKEGERSKENVVEDLRRTARLLFGIILDLSETTC